MTSHNYCLVLADRLFSSMASLPVLEPIACQSQNCIFSLDEVTEGQGDENQLRVCFF